MIAQIFIAVFGVASIWLSQDLRPNVARWGCVAGLISQPFWYYAAIEGQQWGILVLSFFYTVAWCKGFYNYWIKNADIVGKWIEHDGRENPFAEPRESIDIIEFCGKQINNTSPWACGGFWVWTKETIAPEDIVKYRKRESKL